ncbi:glycosyltransferase [Weissella cibaria]|uniref:glycosyltransferase n=1 Tax=Weissella cibaria TaxID=137591 RepID=UPI000BFF9474|nr:glycosyltransferase [Weissella cibaria]
MDIQRKVFFSVIIPVYKSSFEVLSECLNHVISTFYKELEIIVVLDGDDYFCSPKSEWNFSDERIHIIYQQHGGLGAARNTGLSVARGEYILFVDVDDTVLPNMFEKLNLKIQNNGKLDIILFPWQKYDGCILGPVNQGTNQSDINVAVWNKCYRRMYINDKYFEKGVLYEDIIYTFQTVFQTDRIGHVTNEPLYLYRVNNGHSITGNMPNQNEALISLKKIVESRKNISGYFSEKDVLRYIYICWKFHVDAALRNIDVVLLRDLSDISRSVDNFPTSARNEKSFFQRVKSGLVIRSLVNNAYNEAKKINEATGLYARLLVIRLLVCAKLSGESLDLMD